MFFYSFRLTNIMILRHSLFALFAFTSLFLLSPLKPVSAEQNIPTKLHSAPPESSVVEEYFGTKVTDPFRTLESLENPKVQLWIKEQSDEAKSILQRIPGRRSLLEKMHDFDSRKSS